jgi:hypothetical protein
MIYTVKTRFAEATIRDGKARYGGRKETLAQRIHYKKTLDNAPTRI